MAKVLRKAIDILEKLADSDVPLGVTQLARELDLDKATVFRILSTYIDAGYVIKERDSGRYKLGLKLWGIGRRISTRDSTGSLLVPMVRKVASETSETTYLVLLTGTDGIMYDSVDAAHAIRIATAVGAAVPLHCNSAGKAILAWQDDALVRDATKKLKPFTPYTITDPDVFLADLQEIRTRGYAIGQQEWRIGVAGIAVPVRDAEGQVIASIGVSGPMDRLPLDRLHALAPYLIDVARTASAHLGWRTRETTGPV